MKSYRLDRLQNELKKLFNNALTTKINDPRLEWVSVTAVEVTKDLNYAKVYYSHYNNPHKHEVIKDILVKTSGFLKKQIAGAKLMRTIPEINFYYDETEERAARVDALLASVKDDYNDDDEYDPDIDLEDYLDEEEYYEFDEDDEDFEDIEDIDEEDD